MPTLPLLLRSLACTATLALTAGPGAALAAAAKPAPAPQPPSLFFEIISIVLPVAVVLVGLVAVLYFLRKRHGLGAREAPLSILQILPVGPRERIVVLRTRSGRALAVGVAGQSLNLIAELDPADIATDSAAAGPAQARPAPAGPAPIEPEPAAPAPSGPAQG